MIYVFDSSPLINLFKHYYPDRFPSLWENFDTLVSEGCIISVQEVKRELKGRGDKLSEWVRDHGEIFSTPASDELNFVEKIFKITKFRELVKRKDQLKGNPVADPFVIAKAQALEEGCVVTQEVYKLNAAKIPNVCRRFDIPCMDLESFMENEKWRF